MGHENLLLSNSQAACLNALRLHIETQPKIAVEAKLTLRKTAGVLRSLARLGLALQDQNKKWHITARGTVCQFRVISEGARSKSTSPGPSAQRLLDLLVRPMRASTIAKELGITPQAVRQLSIKLYARGLVRFANPEKASRWVMRADDKTILLSREEARVLSAIPEGYSTTALKIKIAARIPDSRVVHILERLLIRRLVAATVGLRGTRDYRITNKGLQHPQRVQSARRAQAPRLPVQSDRIRKVLSAIFTAGELRIIDVANKLSIPQHSMNALMQYLKGKGLVKKNDWELHAPYSLTTDGLAALKELTQRQAA